MTHPMIEEAARALLKAAHYSDKAIQRAIDDNTSLWIEACFDALIASRIALKAAADEADNTGGNNGYDAQDAARRIRALSEQIGE